VITANETGNGGYWTEFASQLRKLTRTQKSKSYFLSAASVCCYSNRSASLAMLQAVDFVWPKFYVASSCNIRVVQAAKQGQQAEVVYRRAGMG